MKFNEILNNNFTLLPLKNIIDAIDCNFKREYNQKNGW